MRENTDPKKSEYGQVLRSDVDSSKESGSVGKMEIKDTEMIAL